MQQIDNSGPDKGRNGYTKIARRLIKEAAERGNMEAVKIIFTRLEGLPRAEVNLNLSGEVRQQVSVDMTVEQLSDLYSQALRYGDTIDVEPVDVESLPAPRPPAHGGGGGQIRIRRGK
jgi:hypothetical protein